MISLKTRDTQAEATYRRVIGLLLQGIALHAVEGTDADRKRFQEQMDQCNDGFSSGLPVSDLLALVGRVLRAMEDYNRRTSKFVEQQSGELQRMVSVLIETVVSIGEVTEKSLSALQEIDKSMGQAKAPEDLRVLRLRLAEHLEAVREGAARQTKDRQSELLTACAEAGSEGSVPRAARDAATGLLNADVAGQAIRSAVASPDGKYLLIAVLSRVQAINARFGYALGTEFWRILPNISPRAYPTPIASSAGKGRPCWPCWTGLAGWTPCARKFAASPIQNWRGRWKSANGPSTFPLRPPGH